MAGERASAFTSGDFRLTATIFLFRVEPSRPPEGHSHEVSWRWGGMRHLRGRLNISRLPGRHSGSLPAALETAGRSDWPWTRKRGKPRGAPSWRGAAADAPGSGDPGPPGVIVRAVRRDPDNASSRRVTPLVSRGRKETGSPAPDLKSGTSIALASRSACERPLSSPGPSG